MEHLRDLPAPAVLRAVKVQLEWEDLNGQTQTFERIIRVVWPWFDPAAEQAPATGTAVPTAAANEGASWGPKS